MHSTPINPDQECVAFEVKMQDSAISPIVLAAVLC